MFDDEDETDLFELLPVLSPSGATVPPVDPVPLKFVALVL
jgi:hypothetical protein